VIENEKMMKELTAKKSGEPKILKDKAKSYAEMINEVHKP
jgi:transposase-like protein